MQCQNLYDKNFSVLADGIQFLDVVNGFKEALWNLEPIYGVKPISIFQTNSL